MFLNYNEIVSNGANPQLKRKRGVILEIFSAALERVNPYNAVKRALKIHSFEGFENIYAVGFGKASVGMGEAVCDSLNVKKALVITNDPLAKSNRIEIFVGGHPFPNEGSIIGTKRVIKIVEKVKKNDLLIVLVSGGGSSLLCYPRVSLRDFQETTSLLLKSGADINEINTVRKHLSLVKGGQLVKNVKGSVISLIISDIIDDPLESISSGPTSPDPTTFQDAKKVLEKYNLWRKIPVKKVIEKGIKGEIEETPTTLHNVQNFIIANNKEACTAAYKKANDLGYKAEIITLSLKGEAREAGKYILRRAEESTANILISGGETTVTVKGKGKGGRNQELVLGCIEEIADNMVMASLATDGIDGMCDAAGAIADGFTLPRAREKGLDPKEFLKENNSYEFFKKLKDLLFTGHTGTNVMDIQLFMK